MKNKKMEKRKNGKKKEWEKERTERKSPYTELNEIAESNSRIK